MWLPLCLLGIALPLAAKMLEVEVNARSAILMNAETGRVLFEKEPHTRSNPASTTKIATALFVLEQNLDLETPMTVSGDCLRGRSLKEGEDLHPYWLDPDGTMMGLKKGETVSLDALLHGLMLVSGNDAANTIAESTGGSIPAFVDALNLYLERLGCQNTQFQNPHGLTHPAHFSTAYDLALITKRALQIPKFRQLVSTLSYLKPKTNKQQAMEIKLTNPFLKPKSKYYYSKATGVKTGHTAAAGYPFVGAATHEGRSLIAVVLGCDTSADRFQDARRLFEKAFSETKMKRRLVGPETVFTKELATSSSPLKASLSKVLAIEFFPAEEPECKAVLQWGAETLPIRKGQKVGEVHIQDEKGSFLQKGDLIALESVQESFFLKYKHKFLQLFR